MPQEWKWALPRGAWEKQHSPGRWGALTKTWKGSDCRVGASRKSSRCQFLVGLKCQAKVFLEKSLENFSNTRKWINQTITWIAFSEAYLYLLVQVYYSEKGKALLFTAVLLIVLPFKTTNVIVADVILTFSLNHCTAVKCELMV